MKSWIQWNSNQLLDCLCCLVKLERDDFFIEGNTSKTNFRLKGAGPPKTEAVAQKCSVKKVFLEISQKIWKNINIFEISILLFVKMQKYVQNKKKSNLGSKVFYLCVFWL